MNKKTLAIFIVIAIVAIVAIVVFSGGSSIAGTWEAEDGYAIMFTNNGKVSDNSSQFSPSATYSVDNGKLHIIDPLANEHLTFIMRKSGNTLTLIQGSDEIVFRKR